MKFKKASLALMGIAASMTMVSCNNGGNTPVTPETIKVTGITLDKQTLSVEEQGKASLTATIAPENATVKLLDWSSSNEDVAVVSASGVVRGIGEGTATITVKSKEEGSTVQATCTVTVTKKDRTIHVTSVAISGADSVKKGEMIALTASVTPDDATDRTVSWSSDHPEIASVNANGVVTGLSKGTVIITATSNDDETKTATKEIEVIDDYKAVTDVTLNKQTLNMSTADKETLVATIAPEDATNKKVTFSVAPEGVVNVDSLTGAVTALNEGTAVITATSEDNPEKKATCNVTVLPRSGEGHVKTVTIPESVNVNLNEKETIVATLANEAGTLPANQKVTFEVVSGTAATLTKLSDNVYQISAGAEVGDVVVKAKSEDGNVESNQCTIHVVDPVTHVSEINVSGAPDKMPLGTSENLAVEVLPANATNKAVSFLSNNTDAVIVDSTGHISAVGLGTAKIKVMSVQDPSVFKEVTIQVIPVAVSGVSLNETSKQLAAKETLELVATVTPANAANKNVSWSTSDNTVAKVSQNGLVTAVSEGDAVITVTTEDGNKTATCNIHVVSPDVTRITSITKPASILSYEGTTHSLDSTEKLYENGSELSSGKFFEYDEDESDKQVYKVGNQGKFKFTPTAITSEAEVYSALTYDKSLEVFDNGEFKPAALADYADVEGNEYEFKDAAIGKKLRLTVTPTESSSYYISTKDREACTTSFEFIVVEGYNAYTLGELSLFDNHIPGDNPIDWTDIRKGAGVDGLNVEGGIILHNDIAVTSEVLPTSAIYTTAEIEAYLAGYTADFNQWWQDIGFESADEAKDYLIGTPRDYGTIFSRNTYGSADNDFAIEGNYFSLNASEFKPVAFMDYDGSDKEPQYPQLLLVNGQANQGAHAQLFGINTDSPNYSDEWNNGSSDVTVRNLNIIGNGGLSDSDKVTKLNKGSYFGFKNRGAGLTLENTILVNTFSGVMSDKHSAVQRELTSLTINKSKIYNSYNSALYFFGTKDNEINDSWFNRAGGPLVLMDENPTNNEQIDHGVSHYQTVGVANNTYLNNPVTGAEAWFEGHAGSKDLVQQQLINVGDPTLGASGWFGLLSAGIRQYAAQQQIDFDAKTTCLKDNENGFCNFLVIDICAHRFANNIDENLTGSFTITNGNETGLLNMAKVAKNAYTTTPLVPTAFAPVIMESSAGGLVYVNGGAGAVPYAKAAEGDDVALFDGGSINAAVDQTNIQKVVSGNFLSYYMDPMAAASATNGKFVGVLLGTYSVKNIVD